MYIYIMEIEDCQSCWLDYNLVCDECKDRLQAYKKGSDALLDYDLYLILLEKGIYKVPVYTDKGLQPPSTKNKAYLITLTLDKDHVDNPLLLLSTLDKINQSKAIGTESTVASIELTKAGVAHMHIALVCTGYPRKRDIEKWHKGGIIDFQKVRDTEADYQRVLQYVKKDTDPRIINYLQEKNMKQFYIYKKDGIPEENIQEEVRETIET